jgi:PAS domain S-box-containing protein
MSRSFPFRRSRPAPTPASRDLEKVLRLHGDIAERLGHSADPSAALRALLVAVSGCDNVDVAGVYVRDDEGDGFELVAHLGLSERFAREVARIPEGSPASRRLLNNESPTPDEMQAEYGRFLAAEGLAAAVSLPVLAGGEVVGALNAASRSGPVSATTRRLLATMVAHVGTVIARQHVEVAHRHLRRNLRVLVDTIDDFIVVVDLGGTILHYNRAVQKRLAGPDEDLNGQSLGSFFAPDRLVAMRAYVPRLRAGETVAAQISLLARDGTSVPAEMRAVLGEWDGRPAVFVIARDITERLAAEAAQQRLVAAVENAAEGFFIVDAEGTIEYVNPALLEGLLYEPGALLGRHISVLRSERTPPEVFRDLWDGLRRGASWRGRLLRRRRDGAEILAEGTIKPMLNDAGELTHAVGVMRDVTREVVLETRLRETEKLEAIGTLAGGIAHDFNNVLYAIQGFAEIAREEAPADGTVARSLEEILRGTERAGDLVKQMLAFGRRAESVRERVSLGSLVEETLALVRTQIDANVALEARIERGCCEVVADPGQIRQVLLALFANAREALGDDGGRLGIVVARRQVDTDDAAARTGLPTGEYAALIVSDTGSGMTEEVLARAFEPYFTTRLQNQGAGMGLAVAHGIVQSHGGSIQLQSEPDTGTEVTVLLPLARAAVDEPASLGGQQSERPAPSSPSAESAGDPQEAAGETAPAQPHEAAPCRVMVVDDEHAIVDMIRRALGRLGCAVAGFTDPREAVAAFRADPAAFDVVLTDRTMPALSGLELAEELLNLRPDLPIILTTGYCASSDQERARSVGVRALLQKPVNIDQLARLVKECSGPAGTRGDAHVPHTRRR